MTTCEWESWVRFTTPRVREIFNSTAGDIVREDVIEIIREVGTNAEAHWKHLIETVIAAKSDT